MRAPYRRRRSPAYAVARVICRIRGHRHEWTGTHWWCSRCGDASQPTPTYGSVAESVGNAPSSQSGETS